MGGALQGVSLDERKGVDVNFPNIYDRDVFDSADIPNYECEHIMSSVLLNKQDNFYSVLMAIETDFNLEGKGL